MHNDLKFNGKVAIVTGASSGIGAATAALFAELGARVAIGFHRNQQSAERVRDQILNRGGEAILCCADLSTQDGVESMFAQISEKFGPVDFLINNAGSLLERLPILSLTPEKWDAVMDLNLKSAVLCAQKAAASMIPRKSGAIINVGSIAGHNGGGPGAGPYAAAKGALMTYTRSLAKELAPHGIRVNSISPGVIDTPFHETFSTPEMMRNFVNMIPLGRIGTSMECAKVIAFLASDAASYVVGETIEVNGGQLML